MVRAGAYLGHITKIDYVTKASRKTRAHHVSVLSVLQLHPRLRKMPPRRSVRSRASSEPENLPETIPAATKRKREKENATKPRKPAARKDKVLKPVDEDEEGGDSDGGDGDLLTVKEERPAKKARSSTEGVDTPSEAEDSEEEVVKPRGRRAGSKSAPPKSKKKVIQESDDEEMAPVNAPVAGSSDEDEYDDPKPKAKSSRKAKPTPQKAKNARFTSAAPSVAPSVAPPEPDKPEESLLDDAPLPPRLSVPPLSQPKFDEKPSGPKSRLTIHKMVLNDFKSYAGRQVIGPFHKVSSSQNNVTRVAYLIQSFSSIVGPNGSGKSNTIDALLFVFGYRASKMRQGKLSELIHNSARYPDLPECSVEVHFRDIIDLVSSLISYCEHYHG